MTFLSTEQKTCCSKPILKSWDVYHCDPFQKLHFKTYKLWSFSFYIKLQVGSTIIQALKETMQLYQVLDVM